MIVHYVCVAIGRIVEIFCAHIHNVSILSSNVVKEHYVEMIMIMLRLFKKDYVILS